MAKLNLKENIPSLDGNQKKRKSQPVVYGLQETRQFNPLSKSRKPKSGFNDL